jgi:glycosyltransferase involved in cell wall biosynthesis
MKVCIISHFAYGAMTGGATGHIGGVERQTTMLARWLARRDHEVTLLTWDEGQAGELEIDGVLVMKMCARDSGMPGVRFLHPRWTSLRRAMRRADADVYYQNCGDYVTGQVALWCRGNHRPFVYAVASEPDCDPRLPKLPSLRERLLYRYGLTHADRVIVQTRRQQEMLRTHFGLSGHVIPMPCPGPTDMELPRAAAPDSPPRVVWIGRFSHVKRLELMLDVAAATPEIRFEIAGTPDSDDDYSRGLIARVRTLPNVTLKGVIGRHQMTAFYRGAVALLCTSEYEGFPNTFLEAWSTGVPVVSTVEPDKLLSEGGLGLVGSNAAELSAALRRLASDRQLWTDTSLRCEKYYAENHRVESSMPKFEQMLQEAAAARPRPRRKAFPGAGAAPIPGGTPAPGQAARLQDDR